LQKIDFKLVNALAGLVETSLFSGIPVKALLEHYTIYLHTKLLYTQRNKNETSFSDKKTIWRTYYIKTGENTEENYHSDL
jgi:hypothetical protein